MPIQKITSFGVAFSSCPQFLPCRSFKVLKSKKLLEVMDILAEGLVS